MDQISRNTIQNELQFHQQNQSAMEHEMRSLISDNQQLSQQVGALLKEKMEWTERGTRGEIINSQLKLTSKERDSLHVLWQTAQKTIHALETELKIYQSYSQRGEQNTSEDKNSLELKLESALNDHVEIESKHKELSKNYISLQVNLKNKENEIETYKERGKTIESELENVKKSLEELKIELASEVKNNTALKEQLASSHKESVLIVKKEAMAKNKVLEALQLYDLVSKQKKEAYNKMTEMKGELSHLKDSLSKIKSDIETVYKTQVDNIKDKYNEKVSDMLTHIQNLDAELVEKGLLLNKILRESKVLKASNENYLKEQADSIKNLDPKLTMAEQRLEAMYQELVASERRNIQIVCEKQALAIDIQRIQDIQDRETKRRDFEEQLVKTQVDVLKTQVNNLQKSLDSSHESIEKLQGILKSRDELTQKIIATKHEEVTEITKHLENQMELSNKWKSTYIEMNERLKNKLEELYKENSQLKSKLSVSNLEYSDSS